VSSSMLFYGYVLCAASVLTMLSSLQIIIGSFLSVVFLKKILYRHHYTAI